MRDCARIILSLVGICWNHARDLASCETYTLVCFERVDTNRADFYSFVIINALYLYNDLYYLR